MNSRTPLVVLAAAGLIGLAAASFGLARRTVAKPEILGLVPAFQTAGVATHGAETVGSSNLQGSTWIAGFIFTRCTGPCPLVMAALVDAANKAPAGVRVMAVTVDPDHDTPKVLARYRSQFGPGADKVEMLRPDRKTLYALAYEGFHLDVFEDVKAPEGARFVHSTRLVLVGPRLEVKGYFDTQNGPAGRQAAEAAGAI